MRRLAILAVAVLLVGGMAYAGDYHYLSKLRCYQCHVMHATTSYYYDGNVTDTHGHNYDQDYTATVQPYLLKDHEVNVCLECHDGPSVIDVFGTNTYTSATVRTAGGLSSECSAWTDGAYMIQGGHTLCSTRQAPGDSASSFIPDATEGLRCSDCHGVHGYVKNAVDLAGNDINATYPAEGAFRNLIPRNFAGVSVTYVKSDTTNNTARDVWEKIPSATSPWTYETDNLLLNEPDNTRSAFAEYCAQCHVGVHNDTPQNGSEGWLRHPAGGVNIGALGGGHSDEAVFDAKYYRVRVMSESGGWGTQGTQITTPVGDLTPTCVTCHKGHGNKNAYGLIYIVGADPSEVPTEEGTFGPVDSNNAPDAYRTLCKQCHVQG